MFADKNILVTGCCGTVGMALISKLINLDDGAPAHIIGIDNSESGIFSLAQQHRDMTAVDFVLSDILDINELLIHMRDVDVVFHAAALKHVLQCERSPNYAVSTNIAGVQNIISASRQCRVGKVIFTSSDKAVNPTNVMGTTKLMGERLITAANSVGSEGDTIFASTRFGNVLGSSGSVVQIFQSQIQNRQSLTITDARMTRFVMTVDEAVDLLLQSACYARGGEVFITKMPSLRIIDLAQALLSEATLSGLITEGELSTVEIGISPGEKIYEELMSEEEVRRSIELAEFFVVLPAFRQVYDTIDYSYDGSVIAPVTEAYVSASVEQMTRDEIISKLAAGGLATIA